MVYLLPWKGQKSVEWQLLLAKGVRFKIWGSLFDRLGTFVAVRGKSQLRIVTLISIYHPSAMADLKGLSSQVLGFQAVLVLQTGDFGLIMPEFIPLNFYLQSYEQSKK